MNVQHKLHVTTCVNDVKECVKNTSNYNTFYLHAVKKHFITNQRQHAIHIHTITLTDDVLKHRISSKSRSTKINDEPLKDHL